MDSKKHKADKDIYHILYKEKNSIVSDLNEEKRRIDEQIRLIENLTIESVNEDSWHKLCETKLRYSDCIIEIAKATFPEGKNFIKSNLNEITFEMNGFNIHLPMSSVKGIIVDMKWYKPYLLNDFKPTNRYGNMRKYFELIEENESNWYELAKCRCTAKLNKKQLFKWWFLKAKWHKVDETVWKKKFLEEDKYNEEAYLKHKEKQESLKQKIKEFHKTVDVLKKWGEVKGYIKNNDVYMTCNIENYLR